MRLVILDRDGVINHDSDSYIKSPEEWIPIPGSLEAIAKLCGKDYKVIVATNQSAIGRGMFDMDMLNRIHQKMLDCVSEKGGQIDAIYFCPHHPDDGCQCRKPKPGLLEDIAERLKVSLGGVPMVGDTQHDLQAAQAVKALPVLVLSGKNHFGLSPGDTIGDYPEFKRVPVFKDLAEFTEALLDGRLDDHMDELSRG